MRRIKRLENLEQESEERRRKDDTLTNFFTGNSTEFLGPLIDKNRTV